MSYRMFGSNGRPFYDSARFGGTVCRENLDRLYEPSGGVSRSQPSSSSSDKPQQEDEVKKETNAA